MSDRHRKVGRISNPSVNGRVARTDYKSVPRVAVATMLIAFTFATTHAAAPITALTVSPEGKQVIAASQLALHIYAGPKLARPDAVKMQLRNIHDVQFSPDGKHLAAVGGAPSEWGGLVMMSWPLDTKRNSPLHTITDDVIFQTTWLNNEQLAVASTAGQLSIISRQGKKLRELKGHSQHVLCVAALSDGKTLISGGADASIRVWDTANGKLLRTLGNHTAAVRDLAVRPQRDGLPMIASAGADKTVRLWQPTIGRMVRFARLESAPLAIAWTPAGDHILAACEDGHLRVIDAATTKIVQDETAIDGWAYAVAASPEGSAIIAGENGQIRRVELKLRRSP